MATIGYTKYAPEYFWDLFSEGHDFTLGASVDGKSVTFTFKDFEPGGTRKLVLSGTSLKIEGGRITAGTITGIDAINSAGKTIYEVNDLNIRGYLFRTDNLYEAKGLVLSGNDKVTGSAKSDDIESGAGNDAIKAGAGDDFIHDFMGADTYDGGADWDIVDFSQGTQHGWVPTHGINANMQTGVVVDAWGFKDKLANVEGVRGTLYADKYLGSNDVNRDEEFEGLAGADTIDGGAGDYDTVSYGRDADSGGRGKVTVDLSKGYAIDGFGDRDTLKNIEEVSGGRFNDTIIGSNKSNYLRGGDGNDTIRGNGGIQDRLEGQIGSDTLYGTKGTDDQFIFRDRNGQNLGTDRVKTFTDGEDVIRFRNFDDIDSKSDLKITQTGADVSIDFGHGKIIIEDLKVAKLTAVDFLFE